VSRVATVTFGEVAGVTPPGSHCRGVAGVAYPFEHPSSEHPTYELLRN